MCKLLCYLIPGGDNREKKITLYIDFYLSLTKALFNKKTSHTMNGYWQKDVDIDTDRDRARFRCKPLLPNNLSHGMAEPKYQ